MVVAALVLLIPLAGRPVAPSPILVQSARDGRCTEWHDCRQQALAAASRGEYETFHDLAWRAIQTGPPKDPALMYLLARAQALSGRPHDALIMLQRLAEMGVPSDAETNDDFIRTRALPGWPDVAAIIARLVHPDSAPAAVAAPAPAVAPVPTPSAAPVATPAGSPSPALEAVRFSSGSFTPGGLAYDAVSHRFVFGDRLARKLIIVSEGANHAVDFVRAESAGFHEIFALEIDERRGDLWVASAAPADGAGTLHKLQLVSGRPLKSFPVAADLGPVTLVDLAVTAAGAVLVLDAKGRQLLALRSGGTALERVVQIDARDPASLTAGGDEGVAYVADRDGLSRIDLRARTATRVGAPKSISLAHLEWIRWHRRSLIAIQVEDNGARRIIRLDLNASGSAVRQTTTLEGSVPAAGQALVTITGNELVYLVAGSGGAANGAGRDASTIGEFVAYRVRLP
jgi:hypothetical protein